MLREPFIPIAVWYAGGRTRATMVRLPQADSEAGWRKDLQTIQACGFNTVRAWVDWATGEPRPGEYHFEAIDLLMKLAEEVGLQNALFFVNAVESTLERIDRNVNPRLALEVLLMDYPRVDLVS